MSFFILYTNEVGERQHAIERYITHYQYHFLPLFFPPNASKHQKRVVVG